jgi:hypothetical protein
LSLASGINTRLRDSRNISEHPQAILRQSSGQVRRLGSTSTTPHNTVLCLPNLKLTPLYQRQSRLGHSCDRRHHESIRLRNVTHAMSRVAYWWTPSVDCGFERPVISVRTAVVIAHPKGNRCSESALALWQTWTYQRQTTYGTEYTAPPQSFRK